MRYKLAMCRVAVLVDRVGLYGIRIMTRVNEDELFLALTN